MRSVQREIDCNLYFCPSSGQFVGKYYTLANHVSGGADTIKVSRTSLAKTRIKT